MGLKLLKISGWDVPESVMKRIVEPVVLEHNFMTASWAELTPFGLEEIKNRIADNITLTARKHITYNIKVNGEKQYIKGSLIIQREDPPNNQP